MYPSKVEMREKATPATLVLEGNITPQNKHIILSEKLTYA